jgi:protein O-GlcNAc transferase
VGEALAAHQAGNLTRAEQLYRQILKANPQHFDALHLVGVISLQHGRYEDALRLITQALRFNPRSGEAFLNHGIVLMELGRFEQALTSFEAALAIKMGYADALYSSGNALRELGRYEQSLAYYNRALAVRPDYVAALNNKANVLLYLKRFREALASYDQVLVLTPQLAEALYNRGTVLIDLQQHQDALVSFDKTLAVLPGHAGALNNRGVVLLRLKSASEALNSLNKALAATPGYIEALNNRGKALLDLKRDEDALTGFEKALAAKPDYVDALNNRGSALLSLMRHDEALVSYDRVLMVEPQRGETLYNRGIVLLILRRYKEALLSFDKTLGINPDYAEALISRGGALMGLSRCEEALVTFDKALVLDPVYADALSNRSGALLALDRAEDSITTNQRLVTINPDYDYASGYLLNAEMQCCHWQSFEEKLEKLLSEIRMEKRRVTPFSLLGVSDSASDQLLASQIWVSDRCPSSPLPLWQGAHYQHDRIRIAYLSADFHDHAMAILMAGLFEQHDRSRFQTTAISFCPESRSAMRARLVSAFDRFIDVTSQSDRQVGTLLRELEVDIAIDLMGFTTHCRTGILASRPAPIQVNYLGYGGTMGADYIDYILADRSVLPEDRQHFYTEKVVYLPYSYQANDSKRVVAGPAPMRALAGLPEKGFVFCCFNNSYKITPDVFTIWMRLLRNVEGSVLWLVEGNTAVVRNLRREAEAQGVHNDRLIFAPRVDYASYLARYQSANLFLDTLPYNAATTASDALWAGLPLITCAGSSFVSRIGASLLNAVGLPELITHSLEEYEALALRLAKSENMLSSIKAKLVNNRTTCPLFDTDGFRCAIERAYTVMWERYQRGEPPVSFSVAHHRKQQADCAV